VDLGILLAYWPPSAPGERRAASADASRWFTPEEIVERYASRSGRDVSAIRFYETFALFKVAVVLQQIFYRYARGQTDDPRFAGFDKRVASLAREATARLGAAGSI
jgi:aminoglycoside phosphotransferase (APT) family kinase protein